MPTFNQPTIIAHAKGELLPEFSKGQKNCTKHSWFVFVFDKTIFERSRLKDYFLKIFSTGNLLYLTESDSRYILSGNAKAFKNYFLKLKKYSDEDIWILNELKENTKSIFDDVNLSSNVSSAKGIALCPIMDYTPDEKIKHWWAEVKMTGSRDFVRQLLGHGRASFSEETAGCDDNNGFFSNNKYIIPPAIEDVNLAGDYKNKLNQISRWYLETKNFLADNGKKSGEEDAKFLLPDGATLEILMSANLEVWQDFFSNCCDGQSDWEIRQIALEILLKFKQIFPDCFDNFEIAPDGMSAVFFSPFQRGS